MPGSEGGDRVHNFFDQEKFEHQHPHGVDGSGLGSSGFHWPGNQRHESPPLNFRPGKSSSDQGRGNLDRQSSLVQSSPLLQSPQRSSFTVSPHPTQHTGQNGYIHNHHLPQAKHDETDFMGMNRVSNPHPHNPFSRGFPNYGTQYRNAPEQHQDTRLETTESPINYNFLGSHQQMNTQQHGMLQPSPRQHSGLNERQLLQQQAVIRNSYDVQRHQQFQKQDTRHVNSANSLSSGQQRPMGQPPSLNNSYFQDGSNYALISQHGAGNLNGLYGVVSPVMQGNSSGISVSTEQSALPHIFGSSPQSVDHSLYGFPISYPRGSSSDHSHRREKSMSLSQQVPSESNPLLGNHGIQLVQDNAQDSDFGYRIGVQKNKNLTNAKSQTSHPGTSMVNISQAISQQRNPSTEFLGIQSISSSMNSKENTLSQTVVLKDAAPLDPTEEQFLFGSDDNIWDAFGESSNSKLYDYDGSELQNPFPSMQSGSWSALMQSALAETCGDIGKQEERPGLKLGAKSAAAGHEPLANGGSNKQRTSVTNGNLHTEHSLDTNHYMNLEKSGASSHTMQGFPLSSLSDSSNVNERFQLNSVSKSNHQISEGHNRFDHISLKFHSDGNQSQSKSVHQSVEVSNFKGLSGSWAPQHGTSLNNSGNQSYNKSSPDNFMGSVPGNRSPLRSNSNENIMHPRQVEHKRLLEKDKSAWPPNSFSNSPSSIGKLNSNSREPTGPTLNSLPHHLSAAQNPPVSHHFNHWTQVGSTPEVGSENMNRPQHLKEARPQVLVSLSNSSDNKVQKQSRLWDNTSGNKLTDTFMPGHGNSNVAGGKQQDSDQVAGNSPDHRKYQYHSPGEGLKSFTQNDKRKGITSHADVQNLREISSAAISMPHLTNKTIQSSHNMAEFLNKARQSRENSAEASRNSIEQNILSEKPSTQSPETSMSNLKQSQFLGSQTHGLQLGLPHQRFSTQINQNSSQAPDSFGLNSGQFALHHPSVASKAELHDPRFGDLGQSGLPISLHNVHGNFNASISSGTPNLGKQLQNTQSCEEHSINNSGITPGTFLSPLDRTENMFDKTSFVQSSVRTEFNSTGGNRNPAPLPLRSSIEDENIQSNARPRHVELPSLWPSVPNQKIVSRPDAFTSKSHMETFVAPNKKDELITNVRRNYLPGSGAHPAITSCKSAVPGETGPELKEADISGKYGFPFNDTVTQANLDIIGNSVMSDAKLQNSYSLLHQLQAMRSTEVDPNSRESKRPRVQSNSSDAQQSPSRFGQHQNLYSPTMTESGNRNLAASVDSKTGKYISVPSNDQGNYLLLPQGTAPFQNTQNNHTGRPAMSSVSLSQISPQMAPSWFERVGSFNMEQQVPASDVWKSSITCPLPVQTLENSSGNFVVQNQLRQIPAPLVVGQVGDTTYHSDREHVVIGQSTSPKLTAITSPSLVSVVHKLTTATVKLLPWYEEVTQPGLRDLPNIRASEVKWASATKRIPEKVMVEMEQANNRILNSKRRLVLTTQLMQQLLDPPPASVMSSDAYKNLENVIYFSSRVSSGSACSLSVSQNHCITLNHDNNMTCKKVIEQGDTLLSKVANDFLVRASKLENTLSGLEKQTLIQDLRVEWQDVEKISVINRFAKFHGRGQADGSAIINSTMNMQNHCPQRYVTALPAPRNLPETVQCLSL